MAGRLLDAQHTLYTYRNFDERDGIRSSMVFGLAQDKAGFIWLGTDNGLHRYDGHRFEVFESPLDNQNHNISNELREILYDSSYHRLWLLSLTDFQYFDLNTYSFHRWFDRPNAVSESISYQKYMIKTDNDHILFSVDGEIYEYSISSKTYKSITADIRMPEAIKKNYAMFRHMDTDRLAIIYPDYVHIFNIKTNRSIWIKAEPNEIFSDVYYSLRTQKLYIPAFKGLKIYDLQSQGSTLKRFPYQVKSGFLDHIIRRVIPFDDEVLMLTGMGGYILYNVKDFSYEYFPAGKGEFDNKVNGYYFLHDREGNLWQSSYQDLCNVLYYQNRKMKTTGDLINREGVFIEPYRNVRVNDSLFAFCGSGLTGPGIFNCKNGKYYLTENRYNSFPIVFDLLQTQNNKIVTSTNSGVYLSDISGKEFKPMYFNFGGRLNNPAGLKYLLRIHQSLFLGVHQDSIFLLDPVNRKGKAIPIKNYLTQMGDLPSYALKPMLYNEGKVFLASKFLYEFDIHNQSLEIAFSSVPQSPDFSLKYVKDMQKDRQGKIWISTTYNGVYVYNPRDRSYINIHKHNSCLSNNHVVELLLDPTDRMWMMTPEKIFILDSKSLLCLTARDKREGFPAPGYSAEIGEGDHVMTFNNYPIIRILDFDEYQVNLSTRPTWITSFKVNGVEKINVPTQADLSYILPHHENSIVMHLTNLTLNNSHNNQYRYRLEGLDSSWLVNSDGIITYERLPSGKFTLQVQSSNNEGVWDPHLQRVTLTIQPVFYKSWWFISLMIILLGAVLYFYQALKLRNVRNEEKLKRDFQKKIAEIEMKALRAQMNPHFLFNSLNSIQKFIFEHDDYSASQYLTKFSRLIRLILDSSNQDFIPIGSEIELLNYYIAMEQLRFSNRFSFSIYKDPAIPESAEIPSMVIQPYVENAIWHGLMHKEGECILSVHFESRQEGKIIQVTVLDNGVGRVAAEALKSKSALRRKSFGTRISGERIHYFSELTGLKSRVEITDLYDDNGNAAGTKVVLELPVKNG